jgi:hypothetical protein
MRCHERSRLLRTMQAALLTNKGFYADLYNSQFTGSGAQSTAAAV